MDMKTGPTLLLLRHGQIKANRTGHWHGSTDTPLTFKGRRQAKRASQHLTNIKLSAVYASPLIRCQQTATIATKHTDLEIQTSDGLQEMSIGAWEAISFKALQEEHGLFASLKDPDFCPPDGESLSDVSSRVCNALVDISAGHSEDETVLVVSHGVAMAVAVATFLHDEPSRWRDYHFDNCGLTEMLVSPEPVVVSFNQSSHL
jgi:broad specificity phosphatase PhoE